MKQLKPLVTASWWDDLSEQGKSDYIAANPNCKQARDQVYVGLQTLDAEQAAEEERQRQEKETADAAAQKLKDEEEANRIAASELPETLDTMLENVVISPEEHEFVAVSSATASERRLKMGARVQAKAKALVSHLKRQPEWSRAAKGFQRILSDKAPHESDAKALSRLMQIAFEVIATIAVKEEEAGISLIDTLAVHDMEVAKSIALSMNSSPEVVAGLGDSRTKTMTAFIEELSKFISHGEISVAMWGKGLGREAA